MPEIKRRITFGMGCLQQGRQHHEKPQSKHADQEKVFNEYVLPVMTYGSETWALTTPQMDALAVAQRKMERIMLGITLRDQRHNTWIWQQTGVTDIIDRIRQSKHRWVGHVARLQDNRWTIRATSCVPRRWLRPRGRPKTRWRDDLSRHLWTTWTRLAQDRHQWKLSREGFLHKKK